MLGVGADKEKEGDVENLEYTQTLVLLVSKASLYDYVAMYFLSFTPSSMCVIY